MFADTPPLLFEASSLENAFQIGGFPWHYIITPNKKKHRGVFYICSLKDNALVIYSDSSFSEINVYHVCPHLSFWALLEVTKYSFSSVVLSQRLTYSILFAIQWSNIFFWITIASDISFIALPMLHSIAFTT